MPSNPADHSGRLRRRIPRQQSEDVTALEQLLADACPEPALPRDLVHTICTRATRQRELRQLWKIRIAASAVVVLLLVFAVSRLPERDTAPAVPAPAHFESGSESVSPASSRTGPQGSQWDWNAPEPAPESAPEGAAAHGAAAADAGYIDRMINTRRRAGDRLRSVDALLP
ncbi:MAG: hypothetical protein KDA79_02965 [Planctomycetaceae bacterium]|nr:hypothetical protein [Planctomycetaceae bacterium]